MKNILYMGFLPFVLLGCGGGGSDSVETSTNGGNNTTIDNSGNSTTPSFSCQRGFPTSTIELGRGIFNEDLYRLDVSSDYSNSNSRFKDAFVLQQFHLEQNLLYKQFGSASSSALDFINQREKNFFWANILTSDGVLNRQYYQQSTKGWPLGYISQQEDNTITFSEFNDSCNLNADKQQIEYEKIDLSGLPLSTIYKHKEVNVINRFSPTQATYKVKVFEYINNDSADILSRSIGVDSQNGFDALMQSKQMFPQDAVVYIPKRVSMLDTTYYFEDAWRTDNSSLESWAQLVYPEIQHWQKEQVAGHQVYYAVTETGEKRAEIKPAIQIGAAIYNGGWSVKGDVDFNLAENTITNYKSPNAKGEYSYFNKAAAEFMIQNLQALYQ